jgi:hypothetical protein
MCLISFYVKIWQLKVNKITATLVKLCCILKAILSQRKLCLVCITSIMCIVEILSFNTTLLASIVMLILLTMIDNMLKLCLFW